MNIEAVWAAITRWVSQIDIRAFGVMDWSLLAVIFLLVLIWGGIRLSRSRKKLGAPSVPDTTETDGATEEMARSQEPDFKKKPSRADIDDADTGKLSEESSDASEAPPKVEPPEPAPAAEVSEAAAPVESVSLFARLKNGLAKTRNSFAGGLDRILAGVRGIDDDTLEDIEELLITSDVGVQTTTALVQHIAKQAGGISDVQDLKAVIKSEILNIITQAQQQAETGRTGKPHVIMVVGVNGVGKTTTIGKLSARFASEGKSVLIVAGDTFRAAAIEQLTIWAQRSGADIVKHKENSDPAAVAYDGVEAAMARGVDVVLVDTAGRLHTKVNLMEELKKIRRTIAKPLPEAPHEILLVLDATTGQNALNQAKLFHEAMHVDGLALTKLDGTAKGGMVIGICNTMKIPLKYIGVGEQIEDLQDFDAKQFVDALF